MTKKNRVERIGNLSVAERYLSLLKKSLLDELYLENEARIVFFMEKILGRQPTTLNQLIRDFLDIRNNDIYSTLEDGRKDGGWIPFACKSDLTESPAFRNFVFTAHTMIGRARIDNIHRCLDRINRDDIPGDLIETGVWKGGATIFMRGFLAAHKIRNRKVWVADSFEGVPASSHEKDLALDFSKTVFPYLSVSMEEVQALFERYDLLDDQVHFLKGWFRDTLPTAPIEKLALLRLDGDLYESTMDALENLYAKLSKGGYAIVDDYYALPQCQEAVDEFRKRHGIVEKLKQIDRVSVYWRKT
ncbi:MAG: TylF/MycF/NovP-related O-methyltransferase [Sulfuricellaceae bacterium]